MPTRRPWHLAGVMVRNNSALNQISKFVTFTDHFARHPPLAALFRWPTLIERDEIIKIAILGYVPRRHQRVLWKGCLKLK